MIGVLSLCLSFPILIPVLYTTKRDTTTTNQSAVFFISWECGDTQSRFYKPDFSKTTSEITLIQKLVLLLCYVINMFLIFILTLSFVCLFRTFPYHSKQPDCNVITKKKQIVHGQINQCSQKRYIITSVAVNNQTDK